MAGKKKTKKKGRSRKPRSAAQRAATKRMIAANRAKRGHKRSSSKRSSSKRKGSKRAHSHGSSKSGYVTKAEFHRHVAADGQWKRKQAVINTIAISSIKQLYGATHHAQPNALRALPVGPSGPAHRRLHG